MVLLEMPLNTKILSLLEGCGGCFGFNNKNLKPENGSVLFPWHFWAFFQYDKQGENWLF